MNTQLPPVSMNSLPVRRYATWHGCWKYVIETTDDDALQAGYISPDYIPSSSACSFKRLPGSRGQICSRLKNGRLRLRIDADSVIRRDAGFRAFMGSILADTRLSLVRGERL